LAVGIIRREGVAAVALGGRVGKGTHDRHRTRTVNDFAPGQGSEVRPNERNETTREAEWRPRKVLDTTENAEPCGIDAQAGAL